MLVVVVGQESMLVSGDVVSAGVALGGCGVGVREGVAVAVGVLVGV